MPEREGPSARRRAIRALMWVLAAAVLVWLFRKTPPREVWEALKQTNPLVFPAVVAVFTFFTLLLDSATHFWLFNRFNPKVDFKTVFISRGETYLLLSFGFLYGQGGMAWSVSRRTGKPLGEVTGSILFLMFNSLVTLMALPTLGLILFMDYVLTPEFRNSQEWGIVVRWLMISWPLIVIHFLFWSNLWDNPLRRRVKRGVSTTFAHARAADYAVAIGLRTLQSINWVLFSWIALHASEILINIKDLFLLGPLVGLISAIPTPGRLGPPQAAWQLLFQNKADAAALLSFALSWTVSVNLIRWLTGAVFLAIYRGPQPETENGRMENKQPPPSA